MKTKGLMAPEVEAKDAEIEKLKAQLREKDQQLSVTKAEAKVSRSVILPYTLAQALEAEAAGQKISVSALIVRKLEKSAR